MSIPAPTLTREDAGRSRWDVLVVGAGPSGALAAHQLALAGASVLLVDKARFPRRKVCGCYVNGSAIRTLEQVGLADILEALQAPSVSRVRLSAQGRMAELGLPAGRALSRAALDSALVDAAISAGAAFLPATEAKTPRWLEDRQQVTLVSPSGSSDVQARVLVAADGVGGQLLRHHQGVEYQIAPRSLVGASARSDLVPEDFRPNTIHMAIGRAGYVGALLMEHKGLEVAAALDPKYLRGSSPGEVANQIAHSSLLPFPPLNSLSWIGTRALSRRPNAVAGNGFFAVGDAAGYIEPFTGEGIAWALATGRAVTPYVTTALSGHDANVSSQWARHHRRLVGHRQWLCHLITRSFRRPWLSRATIWVLRSMPALAAPLINGLNRAPQRPE